MNTDSVIFLSLTIVVATQGIIKKCRKHQKRKLTKRSKWWKNTSNTKIKENKNIHIWWSKR